MKFVFTKQILRWNGWVRHPFSNVYYIGLFIVKHKCWQEYNHKIEKKPFPKTKSSSLKSCNGLQILYSTSSFFLCHWTSIKMIREFHNL